MFTNIFTKKFRVRGGIISVSVALVMVVGTSPVFAQSPLFTLTESMLKDTAMVTTNSQTLPAPLDSAKISFQEVTGGLIAPIFITHAGDGSGRLFVIEQQGRIRILKNGTLLGIPFLDIQTIIKSGGEQGLLALAFHPSYSTNGIFFVAYTAPRSGDTNGSNLVLERFSVSANNPDLANPNSGVILLTISHPVNSNHNGGTLAFGADSYLYWSTGDGGSGGDPLNNAQQLNNLLGKILRIDVNSSAPYGIPAGNPFFSSADPNIKKEIWAYGLRNPWRMSFDKLTHDLYIGDVGQSAREEVDFQPAASTGGENYGWRVMEGSVCYNPSSGCDQSGKILPVAEYDHTLGCSITGGHVYRGSNFPSLSGYYFYGDFCSGRLFSLYKDPTLGWKSVQLLDTPYTLSTFGEDQQGELYLADFGTGKIYNIRYQDIPMVSSSVLAGGNPTDAINVNFTVTFTESVTGVDAGDFSLTTSGVSGATVKGVSGTGSIYTVTVNTGSGNGTIRLDVVDDNSIVDSASNPLGGALLGDGNFTTGQAYTINKPVQVVVITDTWAVRVLPSANISQLATNLGAQNLGQIGSLSGYYLFRVIGSETQSATVAALFAANSNVLWFEQQIARQQEERGSVETNPPTEDVTFQDNAGDVSAINTLPAILSPVPTQVNIVDFQPSPEPLQLSVTEAAPTQIAVTIIQPFPTTTQPFTAVPASTQTTITQIPPSSIPTKPIQASKMAVLPNEPSLSIHSAAPSTDSENRSNKDSTEAAVLSIAVGSVFFSMRRKMDIAGKSSRLK